ncbi:MAG: hypothetical protein IJC04_03620 [Oscillospiraceae bacterium]|nr:hypothetical protein [Oscillospiraceae bacterium]
MMDIKFLETIAQDFRNALEIVVDKRLYGRLKIFERFPNGCCRYTSDLLAEYMLSKGIPMESIQMIDSESNSEQYTHCWLVIDNNIIVDVTADQFNYEPYFKKYEPIPSAYVGMSNAQYLHSCFYNSTMQSNYNIGINSYCGDTPAKLKIVYDAIIEQIESHS